jgi:hypothetical protein
VAEADKYFKGKPVWTQAIVMGAVVPVLIIAIAVFGILIFNILSGDATVMPYTHWIMLIGSTTIGGLSVTLYHIYHRYDGFYLEPGPAEDDSPRPYFAGIKKDPSQCILCNKHPVSKKYHLRHVHNLRKVKVEEYFRNCGCNVCNEAQYAGVGVGV